MTSASPYRVRLVFGPAYDANGPELANVVRTVLEREDLEAEVSYRADSGLVVVLRHAGDTEGKITPLGAVTAGANMLELVSRALERHLTTTPKARRAWATIISTLAVRVEPAR